MVTSAAFVPGSADIPVTLIFLSLNFNGNQHWPSSTENLKNKDKIIQKPIVLIL